MKRAAKKISDQMKNKVGHPVVGKEPYEGNTERMVSTGSTLLDLAICGHRVKGGGIPGGILVEIFGPAGSGKTVMLCELAGAVQRAGGQIMFRDPEARLNKQFARLFDLDVDEMDYATPSTVPEVFKPVREWKPDNPKAINGVFADSLAALSTNWEMEDKDQYGMRRAKEFSEELRKTCRTITENNLLMVCSNQVRQNLDAGPYGQKYKSPGGEAIGFYSSLRLRCMSPRKIKRKLTVKGKEHTRVIGVETEVEVFKSSVSAPYRTAPLCILFDYGIDDIRTNLQFLKSMSGESTYTLGGEKLAKSLQESIAMVEEDNKVQQLRGEVIDVWEELDSKFRDARKLKER